MAGERVERRLAAVLAADVAGYSRLMGADEVGTLAALRAVRCEVVDPAIAEYRGRIVKTTGDGMLVEFASAVDAVTCAMDVQEKMIERGGSIRFRIGVNIGDIIIEGADIFGDGVNVAARVENECDPGGVFLSEDAFRQIRGKTSFTFDDLGERPLKNIERPVRLYAGRLSSSQVATKFIQVSDNAKLLSLPDKPSIAVLPFQNMSGDPEQEYFADGMVEEITTALSRFNSLFVIARNSAFRYKGKAAIDLKQAGRELGVGYLLEGSVRKAGGRIRITGQLIEAATGAHLWADKFEGPLDDIFELQDRVTSSVVGVIAPKIERAEIDRATRKPTENLEAYDWYLRGLAASERLTHDAPKEAIRLFKKAIELDPGFAGAMASIGTSHLLSAIQGWMIDRDGEVAEAVRYVRQSQEFTRNDPLVLAKNALTLGVFTGDLKTANSLADRAISLNPNDAAVLQASGWIKLWLGHLETAIEHFVRNLRLNPFDRWTANSMNGLAWAHLLLGNAEEACVWAQKALAENPIYLQSLRVNAALEAALGEVQRARQTANLILEINPRETISTILTFRLAQRTEDRAKILEYLRAAGLPE